MQYYHLKATKLFNSIKILNCHKCLFQVEYMGLLQWWKSDGWTSEFHRQVTTWTWVMHWIWTNLNINRTVKTDDSGQPNSATVDLHTGLILKIIIPYQEFCGLRSGGPYFFPHHLNVCSTFAWYLRLKSCFSSIQRYKWQVYLKFNFPFLTVHATRRFLQDE